MSPRHEKATIPSLPAQAAYGPAMGVLRHLVAEALGTEARAHKALEAAGASAVAIADGAVVAFAHERLAPRLVPELGSRLVLALLAELDYELARAKTDADFSGMGVGDDVAAIARTHGLRVASDIAPRGTGAVTMRPYVPPATAPPTSNIVRSRPRAQIRPRTALFDDDRYRRATLAQRLSSSGCDVAIASSVGELATMLVGERALHAVLIDQAHPWLAEVVRAVSASEPRAALVVLAESSVDAHRVLVAAKAREYHLHIKDEPATELVSRLRSFAE